MYVPEDVRDHYNRYGERAWHAPVTRYTSKYMEMLLKDNGCRVVEMASTHTITSSYTSGLDKISSNPGASEMLLHLERAFCTKPGLVDVGQRLIVAGITPGPRGGP